MCTLVYHSKSLESRARSRTGGTIVCGCVFVCVAVCAAVEPNGGLGWGGGGGYMKGTPV